MKIVSTVAKFGATLGLLAMASSAQAVVITVFTDAADWTNGVGPSYVTEDFNDATLQAPLQSITGLGSGPSINGIAPGKLWDRIDQGAAIDTVFSFNPGVYGMGGTWDLAGPGGPGVGIEVSTNSGTYLIGEISRFTGGTFWGFTIDEAIMNVGLAEGTTSGVTGVETYTLDNMLIATVPEPAVLALMGMGLVGIGFARRKRNA